MVSMLLSMRRKNLTIISLLLIETYFRSKTVRIVEGIVYLLTSNTNITIGLNQLKVCYWEQFTQKSNFKLVTVALFDVKENYDAAKFYLEEGKISLDDLHSVASYYNGPSYSNSYIELLKYTIKKLNTQ